MVGDYEVLEELIRNDGQVLYRARQLDSHAPILVKVPRRRPPKPADLKLLTHEFELLRELSFPGVPRPLGLSEAKGICSLSLEDNGGAPLDSFVCSFPEDLDKFFHLAIEVCSILAELHRSNVVYRNLSPLTVLANADGRVTLADFSQADRCAPGTASGRRPVPPPLALPPSLQEQAGVVDCGVDHRTDLHSLGVTLYEWLTGISPLASQEHHGLIHAQAANWPAPPREHQPLIPEPVSEIIRKLLSKTPEDCYQSAAGVRWDLANCAREWSNRRFIAPFPLRRNDIPDRLVVPQQVFAALLSCQDLDDLVEDLSARVAALEQDGTADLAAGLTLILNWARALQGRAAANLSLSSELLDEEQYCQRYSGQPFFLTIYHGLKLSLAVIFAAWDDALEAARYARQFSHALSGTTWPMLLDFFYGLTVARLAREAPAQQRNRWIGEISDIYGSMRVLAEHSPGDFACFALLLRAELARLSGGVRDRDAADAYEAAIRAADAAQSLPNEALAKEIYSRFWRDHRHLGAARSYLQEAAKLYELWGAKAKVRTLRERWPDLAGETAGASLAIPDAVATKQADGEKILRAVVEGTASTVGRDFFVSLVRHLASALDVRYCFVTRCVDSSRACMLSFWKGADWAETMEYETGPMPCQEVLTGHVIFHPQQVRRLFPGAAVFAELGAESYLGVPLRGASGRVIGHLAALDNKKMPESPQRLAVLKTVAAWAAAELERSQAHDDLRLALAAAEELKTRLQAENAYLRDEIRQEYDFEQIVGSSPALAALLSRVGQAAPTDCALLLQGEPGSGKELLAREIHNQSTRRQRPLVKVSCGAVSAAAVERELFGHVQGAIPGAAGPQIGRIELAKGGTIFLDEVGGLPPGAQIMLLRVLRAQEFEPVGGGRARQSDVRVIAATSRNLEKEVAAARFNAGLFRWLSAMTLSVPPLRERPRDIPKLVTLLLARFSRKFGKRIPSVSQETMERLVSYSWPGNLRELHSIIERAFVVSKGPIISLDQDLLPLRAVAAKANASAALPALRRTVSSGARSEEMIPGGLGFGGPGAGEVGSGRVGLGGVDLGSADSGEESESAGPADPGPRPTFVKEVERRHILSTLQQASWVIEGPRGAAKLLGLHPNTLRSRLKKLGIRRPPPEIS